jgi:neutral trehalase
MDHIDRRKSANDVQALFHESLKIASELAKIVGDDHNEEKWTRCAEKLRDQIDLEYWDTKRGFYYDTKSVQGNFCTEWSSKGRNLRII